MSAEIKPGQVWAWSPSIDADESQFRIMTVDANRVRYEYLRESDPHIEGGFTHAPATIREKCRLVTDVDATPAPLDPSKVKAGDTVTVRVEEFDIPDPYEVTGKAYVGPIGMAVGGFLLGGDRLTLTAHQPAPEPEPEWKPGTTGTATLNNRVTGNSAVGLRAMRTASREGVPGFALENGLSISDDAVTYSVSDFVPDEPRPLPTRDDVYEAIALATGLDTVGVVDQVNRAVDAVLALWGESR